jgi:hydrogenase maturation protease
MNRRRLVVGLGNTLAGDDGVGPRVAERLGADPRLPADVDVVDGGTDLLALQPLLREREHVVLVDAVLDPARPGTVLRLDVDTGGLDVRDGGVHHLSAPSALQLLRRLDRAVREVPVTLLGVAVVGVTVGPSLSPAVAASVDGIVGEVLRILGAGVGAEGQVASARPRRVRGALGNGAILRQDAPPSSERCTPRSSAAHSSPGRDPAASSGAMVAGGSGHPSVTRRQGPTPTRRKTRPSERPAT